MAELLTKHFDEPDEVVQQPNLTGQIVALGEFFVGRYVHEVGWRWSKDIKPLVGTPSCVYRHQGVVLSGAMRIVTDDGAQRIMKAGDAFDIPPGHDAEVLGDVPCVTIMFHGVRDWARPACSSERVLTSLLFTDIVGSTALASRMGDRAWSDLLQRHAHGVRRELDRFRGYEIKTTGDGFLAMFDGAARAAHCAAAICRSARNDGLEIRAGVHSGEVERFGDNVQGLAVHAAARVAALAAAGEVLLSASTVALLEGSDLAFEDAGEHELKGLNGLRRLFRLSGSLLP